MPEQDRLVADRFRVIRRLGAGAMATVVLAEDCELGRRVAIKRLHPETADDIAPRFRREMRVAASLSHPNVVTLYDATMDDGAVLLIMEYVDGPTLAQRMAAGPVEPDDALAILRGLADAVDYLHAQGIIHRDIKPANILLDRDGRAKLTDLGIASAAQATGITTSGTVLGTPAYMAPELFEGERALPAADIYSLAAIAFEMLSGRRAREGGTPAVMALRATSDPPPDLRDLRPEAGPLADVLLRGMAREPGERPGSATELVDDITRALQEHDLPSTAAMPAVDLPERPAPAPAPQRTAEVPVGPARERDPDRGRRSPAILIAGAAALAVAAIAAILIAGTGGGSDPPARSSASTTKRSGTTTTPKKTTSTSAATTTTTGTATATSTPTTATSTPTTATSTPTTQAAAPSSGVPTTPAAAVRAFYGRAAAHRYNDAWALAAPGLRSQLQGFGAFQRQFSTVRSTVFERAETVKQSDSAATVALTTTTTHTDHVDHCTGTVDTAPGASGGWVVTHLDVNCRGESAG